MVGVHACGACHGAPRCAFGRPKGAVTAVRLGVRMARVVALLASALLVAMAAIGCGSSRPDPPPPDLGTTVDRAVPASIRHLPLITSSGKRTDLAAYHGKTVVLGDFLTLCQEICPMTSANFLRMAQAVSKTGERDNVVFLEVTVDPQRDTPARLAAYRKLFPAPPNWVLATAAPRDLAKLWKYFGVFYQRTTGESHEEPAALDWWTHQPLAFDVAHQDAVVFLDPDGHQRFLMLGNPNARGGSLPSTLDVFLSSRGRRNLDHPGQLAWSARDGLRVVGWITGTQIVR